MKLLFGSVPIDTLYTFLKRSKFLLPDEISLLLRILTDLIDSFFRNVNARLIGQMTECEQLNINFEKYEANLQKLRKLAVRWKKLKLR